MSDYPTEEQIGRIMFWDFHDPQGWLAYVAELWHWEGYGPREACVLEDGTRQIECSTGGWSGNEQLISAMMENSLLWHLTWFQSQRGGHYIFYLAKD